MKSRLLIIGLLMITSIVVILILYQFNTNSISMGGGFERHFKFSKLELSDTLDLQYNSYYLAGASMKKIYLGNKNVPFQLLEVSNTLKESSPIKIKLENPPLKSTPIIVDSYHFYFRDPISRVVYKGNKNDWRAEIYMDDSTFISTDVPIANGAMVIRTSGTTHERVLAKKTINPPYLETAPGILEKQVDGIFCVDGMLNYSPVSNMVVYLYYYRNQYICMDTSLNVLYRANTIDTISQAQIKVSEIESQHAWTMAKPPVIVNKSSAIADNLLFVHSGIQADNEDRLLFLNGSVIDVYDLGKSGAYILSFYIPDYKGHLLKSFQIHKDRLVALHDRYLVTYLLDIKYTKDHTASKDGQYVLMN